MRNTTTHTHAVVRTALRAPIGAAGISSLSLVTSLAALIGGLPALWIALGGHSTLWPALVSASQYRDGLFMVSAALILRTAWDVWRMGPRSCPRELPHARQYRRLRHWNRWILKLSAACWLLGILVAYIAPVLYTALR